MSPRQGTIGRLTRRLTGRMRFPQLFLITAALFVIDLFVPDALPFLDEIFLALASLLFASWRSRGNGQEESASEP